MKKLLIIIPILLLTASLLQASSNFNTLEMEKNLAIDSTDTVFFDLATAQLVGSQLILPVSILTQEPVYSLDFSFGYDHTELDYDTIINLTPSLLGTFYYNPNDSIVRYTSSSLIPITVGVNLLYVNFNLLGIQIDSNDFPTLNGYLNGTKCTAIITNQLTVGLNEAKENALHVVAYPNPASSSISIDAPLNATLEIVDVRGRIVVNGLHVVANQKLTLSLNDIENGVYFIRSSNSERIAPTRFLLLH